MKVRHYNNFVFVPVNKSSNSIRYHFRFDDNFLDTSPEIDSTRYYITENNQFEFTNCNPTGETK